MNTFVDFNTAKLLLDNGFEVFTSFEYDYDGCIMPRSYCNPNRLCSAPTIAEVVMWLYEKHGIWIEVYPREYKELNLMWSYTLTKIESTYTVGGIEFPDIEKPDDIPIWKSLKEAYLAAIEYCINKLI